MLEIASEMTMGLSAFMVSNCDCLQRWHSGL